MGFIPKMSESKIKQTSQISLVAKVTSLPQETGCDLSATSLRSQPGACSALHAVPGSKSPLIQSQIPPVIDGEMEKSG